MLCCVVREIRKQLFPDICYAPLRCSSMYQTSHLRFLVLTIFKGRLYIRNFNYLNDSDENQRQISCW